MTVGRLNLQTSRQRYQRHFVTLAARVHHYLHDLVAIFHGPRCLARYTAAGQMEEILKCAA